MMEISMTMMTRMKFHAFNHFYIVQIKKIETDFYNSVSQCLTYQKVKQIISLSQLDFRAKNFSYLHVFIFLIPLIQLLPHTGLVHNRK